MTLSQKLLEGLNEKQSQAVQSVEGVTLVVAGAGSGKTAVLSRRVAYLIALGVQPSSILCLTFTNKAAREMNERVEKLLSSIDIRLPVSPSWSENYILTRPLMCTFHSLGVRLLRMYGESIGYTKQFSILDTDDQHRLIKEIVQSMNLDTKQYPIHGISHYISQCKQELLTAQNAHKLAADYPDILKTLYKKYEERLKDSNSVDFDDLILQPYILLKEFPNVQKSVQSQWKHIHVDEFQDTNQAQFELLQLLYE